MDVQQRIKNARVKIREKINPILGPLRIKKIEDKNFTIICNNCWGGHVYRYFNLQYNSPTIGLYFYSEDYIKFVYNLKYYLNSELTFINYKQSKYVDDLIAHHNTHCPIGKIDDIEIVFLHYNSEAEAKDKWNRRKQRLNWENIVYKMSEQNLCSIDHLKRFDSLPVARKFVFVTNDYGLKSQVLWGSYCEKKNIAIDTVDFRKYIDLQKFINGNPYFKKRQKYARKKLNLLNAEIVE